MEYAFLLLCSKNRPNNILCVATISLFPRMVKSQNKGRQARKPFFVAPSAGFLDPLQNFPLVPVGSLRNLDYTLRRQHKRKSSGCSDSLIDN